MSDTPKIQRIIHASTPYCDEHHVYHVDFVSATDDAIGGLRSIVRQVNTPGKFNVWVGVGDLALVLASHAALRSSLEEARKDSEDAARWRTIAPTLDVVSCGPRSGFYLTGNVFLPAYVGSASAFVDALRAPSPRDEP